jgi:chromate transporter
VSVPRVEPAPAPAAAPAAPATVVEIPFRAALLVWMRVAALSFGGPAGQIAVMQRILVDEKRWVSQHRFLHALNYCMLLPGPEAQQLAIYLAWLLHGTWAGVVAGALFVLPGFLSILGLSVLYATFQGSGLVAALFWGLKPAVLAVVVEALLRVGRRALHGAARRWIAAFAFLALFLFDLPFPLVLLIAATSGWLLGRRGLAGFGGTGGISDPDAMPAGEGDRAVDRAARDGDTAWRRPSWRRSLRVAAFWLVLWWAPVGALALALGRDHLLVREGAFFGKVAVVTFGGAYSVLAYVAQRAVEDFHWLTADEMLDGLGMAETTPGPLIQVVQFVAFLGAWRQPEPFGALAAGVLGSAIVTWVTFVPCFLWIFLGAPYIEWLRGRRALTDALSAITAAVVGVILDLALWFALHTLFGEVQERRWGGLRLLVPDPATLDLAALLIAVAAAWALLRTRAGLLPTLAAAVLAGLLWHVMT